MHYVFDISAILVKPYSVKLFMVLLQKLKIVHMLSPFMLITDTLAAFPQLL
jgi:hypothetical protein